MSGVAFSVLTGTSYAWVQNVGATTLVADEFGAIWETRRRRPQKRRYEVKPYETDALVGALTDEYAAIARGFPSKYADRANRLIANTTRK